MLPDSALISTGTWITALSAYCKDKPVDLATCSEDELAPLLEGFYCDLRRQDGSKYKRSSYLAARSAIQRHLSSLGRPFNIVSSPVFKRANDVLNGVLKAKKRDGEEADVLHKEAVSEEDWVKIMAYFKDVEDTKDPVLLTR